MTNLTKSPFNKSIGFFWNTKFYWPVFSPKWFNTSPLALASASFNLSAAKLSVTWAFISSPCSRSTMASKDSRKVNVVFVRFFFRKERGMLITFPDTQCMVYLPTWMVNFYGKCRWINHTLNWVSGSQSLVVLFSPASIGTTTFRSPNKCSLWRNPLGIQIRPAFQTHSPSSEGKPLHLGIVFGAQMVGKKKRWRLKFPR